MDVHSVTGAPIFVGGASPTTLAGFALAANSPGKNAASDGKDMGADISKVGPILAVTNPNGGEMWITGSMVTVTWAVSSSVGNVDIDLSADNGVTWVPLVANTANDGNEAVTVPDSVSTQCLVRVKQTAGGSTSDVSDAVFTIDTSSTTTQGAPPETPSVITVVASVNPTVTKSTYAGPRGTQKAWQLEIAPSADGKNAVFISKKITTGNTITVSSATGVFKGSLIGKSALVSGRTYYCRVRQQSSADAWSDWSGWQQPFTVP
jgi:hypothetical protein